MKRFLIVTLALFTVLPRTHAQFKEQTHIHVGVVLPLKEQSSRGPKMVEFYQGMLMAADSLRRNGLFIDVEAHDCGRTAEQMDSLLATKSLSRCDIVFGPLDAVQVTALADYCNLHAIRLVQPFATTTAQVPGHVRHYVVTAPRDTVQASAIDFVRKELTDFSYVLVDTHEQNEEGVSMANALRYNLARDGVFLRLLDIDGDDLEYYTAFSTVKKNLVVLNSPSLKALNKFMPKLKDLMREHPECRVSMLGYPAWQTYTSVMLQDFYMADAFIYTPFYRNPAADDVKALETSYARWFNHPMANTYPRYGIMGYDLAMFFFTGIAAYGNAMEHYLADIPFRSLQTPLIFRRADSGSGFVNHAVKFVHYTPDQDIEVLMRTE